MKITLKELRSLVRTEVKRTLLESVEHNKTPEEIADVAKKLKDGRRIPAWEYAIHFKAMAENDKETLAREGIQDIRKQHYPDWTNADLMDLAKILDPEV